MLHAGWLLALCLHAQVPPEVEKAKATLATKPDDPQANLVVGKYHLLQGEADEAVPCLLKGPDTPLRAAAKAEEGTADVKGAKLVTVGDGWLKAGTGPLRQACMDRASWWYGKAWPDLDAPQKAKLLQRLKALYAGPARPAMSRTIIRASDRAPCWNGVGTLTSDWVHSGSHALCLIPPSTAIPNFTGEKGVLNSEPFFVEPDKSYVFTCWVLTEGTDSDRDVFHVYAMNRNLQQAPFKFDCPIPRDLPVWTKVSLPFTPSEERIEITLGMRSTTGKIYLDDVSVKMKGKEMVRNGGFEE